MTALQSCLEFSHFRLATSESQADMLGFCIVVDLQSCQRPSELVQLWSTDSQSELAAGQAEAASGHWQEWRLFTFPERPEHPRTLLLQRWPHGPSLHLKPAHRQDVEATGYPRPSQKESAKKSAVKAGESARGTAFDAERGELGRVGQGNVNRLAESGHRHPILAPRVHPTL